MSDKDLRILERRAINGDVEAGKRLEQMRNKSAGIIEKVRIDWHGHYANRPTLQVIVNKIPSSEDYVYEKKGPMYFGLVNGIAQFKFYNGPGRGYGGATFNLKMKDGSVATLKGPWSSNASAMTSYGFPATTEVSLTDDPKVWERGHTFFGGYSITIEALAEACKRHGLRFYKVKHNSLISYEPGQIGGHIKHKARYGKYPYSELVDKNGMKRVHGRSTLEILERLA